MSNLLRLGRNSSDLPQNREFSCVCRYVCKSFAYKLFVFPNMVLGKTEYSKAVNARYMFQLLMSFWRSTMGGEGDESG